MRRRFLDLVRAGMASTRAARTLSVCPDTVTDWCRINPDFSEALEAAREESTGILEKRVHQASQKDWRAAAWILERRLPDEYGRKARFEAQCEVSLEAILAEIESRKASALPAQTEAELPPGDRAVSRPHNQIALPESVTLETIVDELESGDQGVVSGNPQITAEASPGEVHYPGTPTSATIGVHPNLPRLDGG